MAHPETILREPEPGELSWLQYRHMRTMAPAYGWDRRYEAHLAHIVSAYLMEHDAARERFWVAERDGELVGCIGLTRVDDRRGRLRLLFVEPGARGGGLGRKLVKTCLRFAREAGYEEVMLWTVDVLEAARAIYAAEGFQLTGSETSELSPTMRDETWLLTF